MNQTLSSLKSKLSRFKPVLTFLLGLPLTIAAFLFIGQAVYSSYRNIDFSQITINWWFFLIGIIFISGFFLLKNSLFVLLTKPFHNEKNPIDLLYLSSQAEIKRYIPGNVFSFISKGLSFAHPDISKKEMLSFFAIEATLMIFSSLFLSSFAFFTKNNIDSTINETVQFSLSVVLALILTGTVILRKIVFPVFKKYANLFLFMCASWILYALGNFFILLSFQGIPPEFFLSTNLFFVLSWAIGYLSFIAPMGLGVREAAIVFLFSSIIPAPQAIVLSVLGRIATIIAELLLLLCLYGVTKIKFLKKKLSQFSPFFLGTIFLAVTYFIFFTYYSFERFTNFFTGRFDLGNMDQTVWNSIHGNVFQFTNPDGTEIISRMAFHSDVLLVLVSPLYLIWSDPRMLLILQTLGIASGAVILYTLSQEILKKLSLSQLQTGMISFAFSLSYLLNPYIQRQNIFDFHAFTFASPLILLAFLFMLKKRTRSFILTLILLATTKETMFLTSAILGLFYAIMFKKKLGYALFIAFFILFVFVFQIVIPQSRGGSDHFALSNYHDLGDSPTAILLSPLTNSKEFYSVLSSPQNNEYLEIIFMSTNLFSLFAPQFLLISVGDFAVNLLSSNDNFKQLYYHYNAGIIASAYIASIYGMYLLLKKSKKYLPIFFYILFYVLILSTLYSTYQYSPLPGMKRAATQVFTQKLSYRDYVANSLKQIPENASVAATNNLGAHLSQRDYIYTIPIGLYDGQYVAFLLADDNTAAPNPSAQRMFVQQLLQNRSYTLIDTFEEYYLFSKN